jgi:anion-transporting  ArsA/GET3 family ATPase
MSEVSERLPFFSGRSVIVCVGSGGVGKTTVSASLALAAAEQGLETLCLTIDPARRLAGAFGLESFPKDEAVVSRDWLAAQGVDAKKTFDDLIVAHCPTLASAQAILGNRVYRHVSSRLSGVRSYMAMEKVQSELSRGRFDLIVLDTPPSGRALDFFDAPQRMVEILDSPATRALVRAMAGGGGLSFDLLALGLKRALSAFDKIVGSSLLEEMAELLAQMNVLFGGFERRARDVGQRMRGSEFGYVLVTSPSTPALLDATSLSHEMRARGLEIEQAIVNRVSPAAPQIAREHLLRSDAYRRLGLDDLGAGPVLRAASEFAVERQGELRRIKDLSPGLGALRWAPVLLGAVPVDLHHPRNLLELGRRIVSPASPSSVG